MFKQFIALFAVLFAVMALTVTPAFGDSHAAIQLAQADDGGDDDGGDDDADGNGGDDTGAAPVRGVQTGAGSTAGLEPALVPVPALRAPAGA